MGTENSGWLTKTFDYFLIIAGSMVMALSLVLFLIPNKITAGGVSGIAMILYHTLNIPAGISMFVINLPLFFIGVKMFGKKFGIKTFLGFASFSVFTDILDKMFHLTAFTHDRMLATVYGGLLLGVGLGIVFRGRGSSGGSDIVARIINKYSNFSLGASFLFLDTAIIIATGVIFRNIDLILFCLIVLGISSKIVDIVIEGVQGPHGPFRGLGPPKKLPGRPAEQGRALPAVFRVRWS